MCALFSTCPSRVRASLPPDEIIFNHEIAIELVWLEERPVLHVLDTHIRLQSAAVLRSMSTEDVCSVFMECLVTLYMGYPHIMCVDHVSAIPLNLFHRTAFANRSVLKFSSIASHNCLGGRGPHQAPTPSYSRYYAGETPNCTPEDLPPLILKGMNEAMDPSGRIPTLLILGALLSLVVSSGTCVENACGRFKRHVSIWPCLWHSHE